MLPVYIPLKVRTPYSLAEGAMKIPQILGKCQELGLPAVGICDSNNLFGALEFSLAAAKGGVQPVIGCALHCSPQLPAKPAQAPQVDTLFLYAQNEKGYGNLLYLVSQTFLQAGAEHKPQISLEALQGYTEGLLAITGSVESTLGKLLIENKAEAATAHLAFLQQLFPQRLYIEVPRHGLASELQIEEKLIHYAYEYAVPLLAVNDVYFADEKMAQAHDVLWCIGQGTTLSDQNRKHSNKNYRFFSPAEMQAVYADIPEALNNTVVFAKRCAFMPEVRAPILPPFTQGDKAEEDLLQEMAEQGLKERLEKHVFSEKTTTAEQQEITRLYAERMKYEIDIIKKMGFPGYFLIVADFIQWAKNNNIPVGPGRGSGAGSVVAWVLKITDLDPIALGLLFERFLNPERVSMPDFDIDFCQDRRDEVITYVQQKYGADKVAQIITFGKLQARAVLRDVGRVLEMPYMQVDGICKLVPNNPANPLTLAEAIEIDSQLQKYQEEEETSTLMTVALQLEGLFRHASTHAAGVVIADRPLTELVPLYRDPKSSMPATQFNMKYVEQAGLVKFDFLGLKTLTVMQRAVELIAANTGAVIDLLNLPLRCEKTFAMLGRGEATAVFQLESSGMRDVLRKLKPDRFEDIIALVALYRPGPMDNIPRYIACKHGEEQPEYLHPKMEQVLKETFGVIIYQEQVMQLAQDLAGYSLGGADLLRRAMGKKIKVEMDAQRAIFVEGAVERGIEQALASTIFDQIAKFASYGFNKSHAAAYALVAYQTAWLKANYPVEFMAATMTYDMGNTDKLAHFRQELERMHIDLLPPDINASFADFSVEIVPENRKAIRYALAAIKGVGENVSEALYRERQEKGLFKDIFDFSGRLNSKGMNKRVLESLAQAGAFDALHESRAQVHASVESALQFAANAKKEEGSISLFGDDDSLMPTTPPLAKAKEWSPLERLEKEQQALGFFLSAHPLDGYKALLEKLDVVYSNGIQEALQKRSSTRFSMAGIVMSKKERRSAKGNKYAFVQLSDINGSYEVMLFSETLQEARELLDKGAPLLLHVDVQVEGDNTRMLAASVRLLDDMAAQAAIGLEISVNDAAVIAGLKTVLQQDKAGRSAVRLLVQTASGYTVALILGQRYQLLPQTRYAIQTMAGVRQVRDF